MSVTLKKKIRSNDSISDDQREIHLRPNEFHPLLVLHLSTIHEIQLGAVWLSCWNKRRDKQANKNTENVPRQKNNRVERCEDMHGCNEAELLSVATDDVFQSVSLTFHGTEIPLLLISTAACINCATTTKSIVFLGFKSIFSGLHLCWAQSDAKTRAIHIFGLDW